MGNIKDEINTLKWQMLARLPKGSIFERVKESIINYNLNDDNPLYYIYWMDIQKSLINKYLFGTWHTNNHDYYKFINWLDENYLEGNYYSIKCHDSYIKIPKPLINDYKCFKAEFLDIIMPYLVQEMNVNQPFLEGPYEYKDVKIRENSIVLDIGANFGLFSSLASSKNCLVYAFEPTPRVLKNYLNRLKNFDRNIHVINKAVSNETKTDFFMCYSNKSSCNKLYENEDFSNELEVISVETTTIDDFVIENDLKSVDFIKADIEGAERKMLMGARETLREYAPNLAICYYHKLDDLKVLKNLILEANPKYEIDVAYKKIYARIPNRKY